MKELSGLVLWFSRCVGTSLTTINTITSPMLAKLFVLHVFSKHGIPSHVTSNRGMEFVSTFFHSLSKLLDMKLHFTSSYLSGDNLFSAPKASQSFSNSNLRHLQHPLGSDHLQVPETLWSTSYSKPLPAVPNTTACSFHPNTSPNTPSKGCSKTSTSSKGNLETSSNSTPSDLNSTPMFFRYSQSCSRDRAAPVASDIKGHIIKVIHDIKGWRWSGSMGDARWWPWLWTSIV